MFKVIFFLYRRPDLSSEQFLRYCDQEHAPLVARVPGLRGYVVNHTAANPSGAPEACDAVAELWFDSPAVFEAALATAEGRDALADQPNYLDMNRTYMIVVEEKTVL